MLMRNYVLQCIRSTLMLLLLISISYQGEAEIPDFANDCTSFLKLYCFSCHAGEHPTAGLALDRYPIDHSLIENREVWESVLDMLTTNQMPPAESMQPPPEAAEAFVAHTRTIFERADSIGPSDPGRVTVRRLNKVEYKNTVRDLLGVDFDPTEDFPEDDIGYGFDNIGDVLSVSPLLMERYLKAAERIAERVILVNPPPPAKRYRSGQQLEPHSPDIPDKPFRLLDPTAKVAWKTGPFTIGSAHFRFHPDTENIFRATLHAEMDRDIPAKVALFIQGEALENISAPEKLAQLVGIDLTKDNKIQILETFEIITRDPKNPQTVETLISRTAHIEKVGIAMVKPIQGEPTGKLQIHTISSEGPLDTRPTSQRKILACTPGIPQAEQTREILTRLLRRAYRRPPSSQEVEKLAQFVELIQRGGSKWEAGIQHAIKIILCSPKFLFRLELDALSQSPKPHPIDEFQLASRLSYFLWSTMPDDELLALAEKKQLTVNLEIQVNRMLANPKALELARNFGTQWLQIQRLETIVPDPTLFPTFTHRLRDAMLKETELFLNSIFCEDRCILELLDANYTFLNQPLANHYGIVDTQGNWMGQTVSRPGGEAIKGSVFQRVFLQGASRGGILAHASVLTATSNPTRTSPVKRGRWVLEQILGSPPPPPPPNVPELKEGHETDRGITLRQRLEQHRADPACANCHAKMDPIGFALENYNAIGAFRIKEGESEIDATATLPDGTSFEGIAELKQILGDRKRNFARCLTEKMLIYALGRGLEYYDQPIIERIVTQLEAHDYRNRQK